MRAIVIVMDSVGIGELPDANTYGDEGSNTVGNIHKQFPLKVPTLRSLGLAKLVDIGAPAPAPRGACLRMAEKSAGKDSVTGHWEMMGVVLPKAFPTFPQGFVQETIDEFDRRIGRKSIGNVVASGTAIIDELGPEHVKTGAPIVYTSADSVFQIAAHEDVVPIDELYRMCDVAFDLVGRGMGVGRVIARPFVGKPGSFSRTSNRRDYALEPIGPTLLDRVKAADHEVFAVGKIDDLFAGKGLTQAVHTKSDDHGMDVITSAMGSVDKGLIFANLVDFDTQYGHRNNTEGYAQNLERFDARLAALLPNLRDDDLLVVTADHGNDPTTPSTDHAREFVPVLITGARVQPGVEAGTRSSFADLGQTLAEYFGVEPLPHGISFAKEILQK
jgi:phosphopentomutase